MKPRSTKYFSRDKSEKNKPAAPAKDSKAKAPKSSIQKNTATQDDTGGGNDSGKRSDDN
jgi:hypothetical protein